MADIIQLLPDSIANQIAAGEVIQRPASVVKELMENSIDAGATEIRLILKDGGKTLIHVIDNGKGMTETDLRMAFERHATSKIRSAADLFAITTMGFRGEALASIAAIAHVDVASKPPGQDLGSHIVIKGSKIEKQEPCQAHSGTSFAVKNLFYNVPARRKFLKSDPVELNHIVKELFRLALAHPEIFFSCYHNDNELYHLPSSNLRQRIVTLNSKKNLNDHLVPVSEQTDILQISGFVSKPSHTKKTKGEQYLFVNQRYIKSNYLNHAILKAYDDMIPKDQYPLYVLFIEIDPAMIDINVHPTKTEIKFEDERIIYNYVRVAVKHALGQYQVTPSIDFGVDYNFGNRRDESQQSTPPSKNQITQSSHRQVSREKQALEKTNLGAWEAIYSGLQDTPKTDHSDIGQPITLESEISPENAIQGDDYISSSEKKEPYQLHNTYIVSQIKSGFILIDQQAAHERILYETYLQTIEENKPVIQKELFPLTLSLRPEKADILMSILDEVNKMGFEISEFGNNTFIIYGTPAGLPQQDQSSELLEALIDQYTSNLELRLGINENIARSLAVTASKKRGKKMDKEEMRALIDQLFACTVPFKSPTGRKCFITYDLNELKKRFLE